MEAVGAAFQNAHHATAIYVAEGGGRIRGQHLHFLQRFRGGAIGNQVVERLIDVDAVQRVVVRLGAIAVHVRGIDEIIAALNLSRARGPGGIHDTRLIQSDRGKVEAIEGEIRNRVRRKCRTDGRIARVQNGRAARYIHRRRGRSHLQRNVECRRLDRFQRELGERRLAEPRRRHCHLVVPGRQEVDPINAVGVGGRRSVDPCVQVVRHHLSARNHCSARIGDLTGDGAGHILRHCRRDAHAHAQRASPN